MVLPYLVGAAIAAGLLKKAHDEKEVRVIVKYKEKDKPLSYTKLQTENEFIQKEEIVEKHDGSVIKHLPLIDGAVAIVKRKDIKELEKDIDVEYVEIDQPVYAFDNVLQENIISQESVISLSEEVTWAVERVNAYNYHQITKGEGIKVAVIDSGVYAEHPDLINNVKGGYNFINDNENIYDDCDHGTCVAGIIAAENNDIGVLGIAPEVDIYSLKVLKLSDTGSCYGWSSILAEAIEWSIENNMDIINLSIGGSAYSYTVETAINKAYDAGILIVAAAGNYGEESSCIDNECVAYPAAFNNVIAVSATKRIDDNIASFSSRGTEVELAAPGYYVMSTSNDGGYRGFYGTSCASPVVAGVATLLMAAYPEKTNVEIREKLIEIAEDISQEGRDIVYGYGIPVLSLDNEEPEPEPTGTINILISKEYEEIESGSSMGINVYTSSNSEPLSSVNILAEFTDTTGKVITGLTNTDGNYLIQYTAPIVENKINALLKVVAYKNGYEDKISYTTFDIIPKEVPECIPNWQCRIPLDGYETDINNCGKADRYNVCCKPEPEPEPEIIESPHNYDDYYDNTWIIYNENTTQVRIHFNRLETEPDFDYVIIYDKYDNEVIRYDGINNNIWTPWVDGDTIKVRLISDKCITSFGFIIDKQEVIYDELSQIVIGISEAPSQTYPSIINNIQIITASESKSLDNVTVEMSVINGELSVYEGITDSNGLFYFNFIASNVSEQTNAVIMINAFKEGYITGTTNVNILINPSVGYTLPIESPHPYPKGYSNTWIVTEPGANTLRVHILKIVTTYPDALTLYDKYDNKIYGRSGSVYQSFWSPWVTGDTMKIIFDGTNGGTYGFTIDDVEVT